MRLYRALFAAGAALVTVAAVAAASVPAGASFGGSGGNGDLVWSSPCNSNTYGQQLFSAAWTATSEQCPGSGTPAYDTVTLGFDDYMPFFSADGSLLYFASQRSGPSAIYRIQYPNTATGTAGSDGATALTSPGSANDYAPVVSADGSRMAFLRCSTATACDIWTQSPVLGGTPVDSGIATLPPGSTADGTSNRPEFNPVNGNQLVFEGANQHIELANLTSAGALSGSPTDLSAETSLPAGAVDEHPDWSPDGTALVFDSTRSIMNGATQENNGHAIFVMTGLSSATPTVTPRWTLIPANMSQIEPVYAPATGSASDADPTLAWVNQFQGSNIVVEGAVSGGGESQPDTVTSNHANNIQVTWQPLGPASQLPENPHAIMLPLLGGALLVGTGALGRWRRGRRPVTG